MSWCAVMTKDIESVTTIVIENDMNQRLRSRVYNLQYTHRKTHEYLYCLSW